MAVVLWPFFEFQFLFLTHKQCEVANFAQLITALNHMPAPSGEIFSILSFDKITF